MERTTTILVLPGWIIPARDAGSRGATFLPVADRFTPFPFSEFAHDASFPIHIMSALPGIVFHHGL